MKVLRCSKPKHEGRVLSAFGGRTEPNLRQLSEKQNPQHNCCAGDFPDWLKRSGLENTFGLRKSPQS